MINADADLVTKPVPALLPALGAMTWLQALVAPALFAPGVVVPRAYVEVWQLASGWNGVLLAELARLAPQDRIGETTGAVLTASTAGLLVAPLLVAVIDAVAGLGAAFLVLAAFAPRGTIALTRGRK